MTDQLPQKPLATPIPANETERLAALHRYKILDTPPEAAFDRITTLAARLFNMPIALISLVDESRAWCKSCIGFDAREVPHDATICSFAVLTNEPLIIPDTRLDERFACNGFVQSEPGVRFYVGAPLLSRDGFNLGTLCLLDTQPHEALSVEQQATLVDLAAMVVDELELRLAADKIAQVDAALLEVTQGVAKVTGEAYFDALVQHFAKVLGADYVYIGLIEGDDSTKILRTIATHAHGQIVENLKYPLQETPCWEVIEQRKICCYPRHVQAQFPNAPLLKPLAVESYVAIPFFDSRGIPLGLLGVMDGKPLENVQLAKSLLTIFALRIATELERQQTEAALRESEAKYRTLFESINEGFCTIEVLFDADGKPVDHRILQANPAFERQFGIANPEGKTASELAPGIEQYWNDLYAQAINTGKSIRTEVRSDALDRWFDVLVSRVGNGATRRLAIVFNDISDRKIASASLQQTSDELERQVQKFDATLSTITDFVFTFDREGRFFYANQVLLDLWGVSAAEAIGKTMADLNYPPTVERQLLDDLQRVFETGETVRNETPYTNSAGVEGYFEYILNPVFTADRTVESVVGSSRDISDRKLAEAALRQSEEQSRNILESITDAFLGYVAKTC